MTHRFVRAAIGPAILLSYPATVVAALWPNTWVFAVMALIGYAADELASREELGITERLAQINAGVTVRFLVRELALLLLLVRQGHAGDTAFAVLAIASIVVGLAAPGRPHTQVVRTGRGAEIVVLIDRSRSMRRPWKCQCREHTNQDGLVQPRNELSV